MSNIIDKPALESYIGKTLNAGQAQAVVDAINEMIDVRTHRLWGSELTVTELYDWQPNIYLRHMDVTNVLSVKIGFPGTTKYTLSPSAYYFNHNGRLSLFFQYLTPYAPGPHNNDYVEVNYTYGTEDVPAGLKLAALALATGFYNWVVNGGKDITRASVGSYQLEYTGARGGGVKTAEERNWAVVDSYAMKRL